jgi:hypothetical protein
VRDLPDADPLAAALNGCAACPGFDPEVERSAERLINRIRRVLEGPSTASGPPARVSAPGRTLDGTDLA